MFEEKVMKIKEKLKQKDDGNNKKIIENLVVFIIILIATVVMINYIWNGDTNQKTKSDDSSNTKVLATESGKEEIENSNDTMEGKLEKILSKVKGVGEVNVLITYSKTSQTIPMYSEDTSQTTTEETDSGGGNRTVNETSSKKDIVYEEKNGVKTPVTQSTINPTIEGAIITAKGANNADVKANIIQAVEAATGLATHKIQVFEME